MARPAWVPTDSSAKTFICPECRLPVPTTELKGHMKFYTLSTWNMAYPCSLCPKARRMAHVHVNDLLDHLRFVHGTFDQNTTNNLLKEETQTNLGKIQCERCKISVKKGHLRKHRKRCKKYNVLIQNRLETTDETNLDIQCNLSTSAAESSQSRDPTLPKQKTPDPINPNLMKCKGCPNQIKESNYSGHLTRCQGYKVCDSCQQSILLKDFPAHKCSQNSSSTNLNRTPSVSLSRPQVPDLIDNTATASRSQNITSSEKRVRDIIDHKHIQCKGCPDQIKATNYSDHLPRCKGYKVCSTCKQSVLLKNLLAHSCFNLPLQSLPELQVPELVDDLAPSRYNTSSQKGAPRAVQINLLKKKLPISNQEGHAVSEKVPFSPPYDVVNIPTLGKRTLQPTCEDEPILEKTKRTEKEQTHLNAEFNL